MREYENPEFHFVHNAGNLKVNELLQLSDNELTKYLKTDSMIKEKRRYQINPDFILREIAGEYAIVPVGEDSLFTNTMMAPNDSAVFLWKAFEKPSTIEDVLVKGMQEYEVTRERIRRSTENFIMDTLKYQILEEVE